jgi:hypothetical protein
VAFGGQSVAIAGQAVAFRTIVGCSTTCAERSRSARGPSSTCATSWDGVKRTVAAGAIGVRISVAHSNIVRRSRRCAMARTIAFLLVSSRLIVDMTRDATQGANTAPHSF